MSAHLRRGTGRMERVRQHVLPFFPMPEARRPQPRFSPLPSHDCRLVPLLLSCVEPRASPALLPQLCPNGSPSPPVPQPRLSPCSLSPRIGRAGPSLIPGQMSPQTQSWRGHREWPLMVGCVTSAVTIETRRQRTEPCHGTFHVQLPEAVPETGGVTHCVSVWPRGRTKR